MFKRISVFLLTACLLIGSFALSNLNAKAYIDVELNAITTDIQRYTVLVLDTSSSSNFVDSRGVIYYTADTAIEYVKSSAKKFIESVNSADGTNHVAIVTYRGSTASVVYPFSTDLNMLTSYINDLKALESTRSVADGIKAADALISEVTDPNAIKNVILFTTGMTNAGAYNYDGHYNENTVGSGRKRTDTGINLYAYANVAYSAAMSLKSKATLYTIGLFQTMDGMPDEGQDIVQFLKLCTLEWATSVNHFYDIKDPNDLEFIVGEVADSITRKIGLFRYPGQGHDYTAAYYYDDAYFHENSYIYNQHLATMSLCFQLSAWGSEDVGDDYSLKMKNAEELLGDIGFIGFAHNYTDFSNNGIVGKPTKDSIGAVAAYKRIEVDEKDYTLIAVAVRGGGYESEWASNFKIGAIGQHQGFSEARDQVITFLHNYISDQGITGDIKLWITGYSRAGAVANMVAGAINEWIVSFPECKLDLSNLYAYTFATPQGTLYGPAFNSGKFGNTFNIINQSDPVPKVAPSTWSFIRYGINRYLPTSETQSEKEYFTSLVKMFTKLSALEGTSSYYKEFFTMKKIHIDIGAILPGRNPFVSIVDDKKNAQSQSVFLDNYITMLSKDFLKNRQYYVAYYQDEIRDICGIFFGSSKSQTDKLIEVATKKFSSNWGWIIWELLRHMDVDDAYKEIAKYLRESLDEAGITSYTEKEFDNAVAMLLDLVVAVAVNHPNLATTLVMNINGIGQAHFPEVYLAWMQSMDSYYTPGGAVGFSSGKYRVVRINCPVDVNIYNDENELVASIIADTPQDISSIITAINEDGEKLVFLPPSDDYIIELIATGDGIMTFSLNEYNPQAGEINRLINYYDIPIKTGQKFEGKIPSYSIADLEDASAAASTTIYTLSTNGNIIAPSENLSGDDATAAYFDVNAVSEDASKGIVFGGGIKQLGAFTMLTVIPYDGYAFLGWYEEGTILVSEDAEYRFRVMNDVSLVAKFAYTGGSGGDTSSGGGSGGGSGSGMPATPNYSFNDGKSEYTKGSGIPLVLTIEKGFSLFRDVRISDNTITRDTHYKVESDPTVVTLYADYLDTLSVGQHTLEVRFTDGVIVHANFTIMEGSSEEPATALSPWINPFTDVLETDWFYEAVKYAQQKGLITGTSATTFSPQITLTRGMMVTILWNHAGKPQTENAVFTDVADDVWYADAVNWAAANGIVAGYGNGLFGPSDEITREQMAVMLYNYAGFIDAELPRKRIGSFADEAQIASWAKEAVAAMYAAEILNGKGQNNFDPQGKATRAEVVAMMRNFIDIKP